MPWSSNPPEPEAVTRVGWWANPTAPTRIARPGWFNPHPARHGGVESAGTLSASVRQIERVSARLSGDGSVMSGFSQIQPVAARFNNTDTSQTGSLTSGLSAWSYTFAEHLVNFSSEGTLSKDSPDGLTARLDDWLVTDDIQGGAGTLGALIVMQYVINAALGGGGTLRLVIEGGSDGLSAVALPGLVESDVSIGTLAALLVQKYSVAWDLAGDGALAAIVARLDTIAGALSGSGSLTNTLVPQYALAMSGTGVLTNAVVPQRSIPVLFDDNFNRANAADCGSNWTQQFTGNPLHINNNQAQLTSSGGWAMMKWGTQQPTNDSISTVVVGAVNSSADALLIYSRSNSSQQAAAFYWDGLWHILSCNGGDYNTFTNLTYAVTSAAGQSISQGDVIVWSTIGERYLLTQNGNTIFDVVDANYAYYPYVDASHRDSAVGYYTPSGSAAVGIDSWHVTPVGMVSGNGSLTATLVPVMAVAAALGGGGTLSATADFPSHSAQLDTFSTAGSYSYTMPYWADCVDVILIGGGGAGNRGGALYTNGGGGKGGQWVSITLTRGTDIPWSTAAITGTVAATVSGASADYQNGNSTTATGTGMSTRTAVGGQGGYGQGSQQNGYAPSPQNKTYDGQTYNGGSGGTGNAGAGTAPGGGGAGGTGVLFGKSAGGTGARGQAWFYAYQT